MGKIKNWDKVEHSSSRIRYGNGQKKHIQSTKGMHHENWITIIDKTVFHSGVKRQGQKDFKTKKEAFSYAMNFMKRNPNG